MSTYRLYLNGQFYGGGPKEYMTELFKDYVETCDMYGKDSVDVRVERSDSHADK